MTRRALTEQVPLMDKRCAYNQECTRSWRWHSNRKLGAGSLFQCMGCDNRGHQRYSPLGATCPSSKVVPAPVPMPLQTSSWQTNVHHAAQPMPCAPQTATFASSSPPPQSPPRRPEPIILRNREIISVESERLKVYSVIAPSLSITLRSGLRRTETRIETGL